MDGEQVARELLRALRGKRSQVGFSRRLGYATNVAYTWEAGRRSPSAAELLRIAGITGGSLGRFFAAPPVWLADPDPAAVIAGFLREVCGGVTRAELARRSGFSRHAVGRWLGGDATPNVGELLALVHHACDRVPDLVACFVDPSLVPSVAPRWRELEARRTLAGRLPWAAAVLRCLELASYAALPAHRPGWIADRLGIPPALEAECLRALEDAGAVTWDGARYAVGADLLVDTRRTGRALAAHWTEVALTRMREEQPGMFGYNVLTVSEADLEALRALHRGYFQQIRALASASSPAERVVLVNVHLVPL